MWGTINPYINILRGGTGFMNKQRKQFRSLFKKVKKYIIFVYRGKTEMTFTKYVDGSVIDTRVKLVNGLNHFMTYIYEYRSEEDIEYVNEFICKVHFDCINGANSIANSKTYDKDLNLLIQDICSIRDERFLALCADYINETTDEDINESTATVDRTLVNKDAKCLLLISLLIKFTYIFSSMIRCDMKYNDALLLFMEELTNNAIRALLKSQGEDYSKDSIDSIATMVDEFLFKVVGYHWDVKASGSYKEKFSRIGIDQMLSTRKNKMDVYSALKKFVPVCVDKETASLYSSDEKAMTELCWTPDKAFEHFRNKNKALAGYIQTTLRSVVYGQDLRKSFEQDINVTDILVNSNEESSLRRDNSLYEDKEGHLLEIRQESAKSLFKLTVDGLMEFEFDLRKELPLFNIQNNHTFNQFILSKIFLSLTGEQRVYKEFYGPFAKAMLALFYIRILDNEDLEYIHDEIQIMKCNGRPNHELYKFSQVEDYLNLKKLTIDPYIFKSILGVYKDDKGDNIILPLDKFTKLFEFLDAPYRVRHLMFPDKYPNSPSVKSNILKYGNKSSLNFANHMRNKILKGVYE